ncbi:galactose-binding transport protein [Shigella flexneri K-227]|uniref:Galactose-binding transport protein n=3 Tax=Shigella flexneri TaxID=623 RepID=F5NX75_SHIFL|nr:galactose-binding transport protein [Shigella flexneri K-272]EGK36196.1 galactose-binding transport protein [Shigella flexneri K-227]
MPCFTAMRAEIALMSGSAFAVTHHAFSSGAGRTSDGNGSHASTLKSPSYTKSVSWQHYLKTEQLQLDTAMWDTAQAKDKMDAWLSGPNANKIEVVIANNDAMAMGAVEALKAHNKSSIPVFGVDALPEALALVKSGALVGTVLNDANNQAKATFDLAKNLADGKGAADGTNWKIDNKVVRVPYVGVDKDNLAEFSKK